MKGVLLMLGGVTFDALTSNYEKKSIFSHDASHCEAMLWASLFGTVSSVVTLFLTESDMLFEATAFVLHHPSVKCILYITMYCTVLLLCYVNVMF